MCRVGRIVGGSTSDPSATCTYSPSRTTEKSSEPQTAQRVSFRSGSPWTRQPVCAFGDLELLPLDPRERLERGAGGGAAARAVAVHRVAERVLDLVAHRTAFAASPQHLLSLACAVLVDMTITTR